jgi:cytochrome c peroxidase
LFDADRGNGAGGFKIPSLRNIALTAPYMHDGRFASLEEVIEHYSTGIKGNSSLDNRLRGSDGHPVRMNISSTEKAALVAFMKTLTDQEFVQDPRFADPFKD